MLQGAISETQVTYRGALHHYKTFGSPVDHKSRMEIDKQVGGKQDARSDADDNVPQLVVKDGRICCVNWHAKRSVQSIHQRYDDAPDAEALG